MLHEEYQISVGSRVREVLSPPELLSVPDDLANLLRSGLESSRYPDLDPGRSCRAAPFIDRCDPAEPYTCYRETNLTSQSYGSSIALNSPRSPSGSHHWYP